MYIFIYKYIYEYIYIYIYIFTYISLVRLLKKDASSLEMRLATCRRHALHIHERTNKNPNQKNKIMWHVTFVGC